MAAAFDTGDAEVYGMVLPLTSGALRDAVNDALRRVLSDGRYDGVLKTYLGGSPQ